MLKKQITKNVFLCDVNEMNVLVLYISVGDTRIGGQLIYHNENELDPMVFRQAAII